MGHATHYLTKRITGRIVTEVLTTG